jgi:hypothetical protein
MSMIRPIAAGNISVVPDDTAKAARAPIISFISARISMSNLFVFSHLFVTSVVSFLSSFFCTSLLSCPFVKSAGAVELDLPLPLAVPIKNRLFIVNSDIFGFNNVLLEPKSGCFDLGLGDRRRVLTELKDLETGKREDPALVFAAIALPLKNKKAFDRLPSIPIRLI